MRTKNPRSVLASLLACAALLLAAGCPRPSAAPADKDKDKAAKTSTANADPGKPPQASPTAEEAEVALPRTPWKAAAVAHGGAGTNPKHSDGCRKAVDRALEVLAKGGDPLDAVVAGVASMEDDPRFNAGTGARVRIDGDTVQMDASLMDSAGRFAAVAVIERVKNPIKVARAVIDTPHLMLAGEGATAFARKLGMPDHDPATPEMREATRKLQRKLLARDKSLPERWHGFDWRKRWNFKRTIKEAGLDPAQVGSDTVGVAVRATDGRFAVALSTGGTAITLRGRVGDVPVFGAGQYAGKHGAMAATGTGERIIEANLGRTVHRWLSRGASPKQAAKAAVDLIKDKGWIGVIIIGPRTLAAEAAYPMAWAGREAGSTNWQGPDPAAKQ